MVIILLLVSSIEQACSVAAEQRTLPWALGAQGVQAQVGVTARVTRVARQRRPGAGPRQARSAHWRSR